MHDIDINELPDDVRGELERREEQRLQRIAFLTISLASKRKKAIDYRLSSGIEEEWLECEESYEGIDDANRGSTNRVSTQKPRVGSNVDVSKRRGGQRSTVFLNITRPYVDAAAGRVADILMPSDDRNFAIEPTPMPDLSTDDRALLTPELLQSNGLDSIEQLIDLRQKEAKKRAEKAQRRIDDWLTECQYHGEARKVIEDCARLGTGVLRGPVPTRKRKSKVENSDGAIRFSIVSETAPSSSRVDPWDIFPDPSCGEKIGNGSYLFERARLSAKQLRDLKGQPGYLDDEIEACLAEGPSRVNIVSDGRKTQEDDRYEVWYFNGQISEQDMGALYPGREAQELDAGNYLDVVCTMINDRIVKAAESHLDSGEIPYDLITWQRRVGLPWGIGVSKQISVPQRMVNSCTRAMAENAGLSSAPQIVRKKGVTPADGVYELTSGKQWVVNDDSDVKDARHAFVAIEIPTRQQELLAIIQFALKMAEDITGLPALMQGNQGSAPDTVGGMVILNNNANSVLRRIARNFDDNITRPHVRRYYEWLMLYGDDGEKGDYAINARGSSALVDRDIQRQTILSMRDMVINPAFGIDPKKWAEEMLRSNKTDPELVMLTPDREQELAMQQQQAMQMQMALDGENKAHEKELKAMDIEKAVIVGREKNELDAAKFATEAQMKFATGRGI